MFSTPRLKPDGWDQFGSAWDPSGPSSPAIQRAYHARNVHDDDEIISFGGFEISNDEYRRRRNAADAREPAGRPPVGARPERPVSGAYEVMDMLEA